MRIRIKFEKKQAVRYLGHLDIMRFFQRVFNRADVKMEYSGGFNPHQKMSFAQPLGVGILSEGDYLDAEIASGQDLSLVRENMNRVCGDGFWIRSVKEVEEGAKKAMAALAYAEYRIDIRTLLPEAADSTEQAETVIQKAIEELLARREIPVQKTTKSGTREVDIRPQILRLSYESGTVFLQVTAGSSNNLKPDTLLTELFRESEVEYRREKVTIIRKELYAEQWIPLESFQTV